MPRSIRLRNGGIEIMLRCLLSFIALFSLSVVAFAQSRNEPRVIYYIKTADSSLFSSVEKELDDIADGVVIQVPANPFYEKTGLGTNAVMCGENTNRDDVLEVAGLLIENGFNIQYIGPYSRAELNSQRNTIDIRSVGDEAFFDRTRPIKINDLDGAEFACGVDRSLESGFFGEDR